MPSVLVAGLCVVDLVHRVSRPPGPDEKVTALSRELGAGGPATNAAVTVSVLGGAATLLTPLGSSALATAARADLDRPGLAVYDLAVDDTRFELNVSSVVVVDTTGERSVVSLDAGETDESGAVAAAREVLANATPDVVLLDGHYPAVAAAVARWARTRRIPVVLDAGRWKPHFAELITLVDEVVASEAFSVPTGSVAAYAHDRGAAVVAQTHGAGPIEVSVEGRLSRVEVPVVAAVDTLGAGDVLHGAYAYHRAAGHDPEGSLRRAVAVATFRCRFAGRRAWTRVWPDA